MPDDPPATAPLVLVDDTTRALGRFAARHRAGFAIPVTMKRMHIDPALAGGVVLTTITDVVGYMAFLGLGALILL